MTFPALVYHAAGRSDRFPPNTLSGLRDCLDAGARFVEVDINPLADGEYALLHDRFLEDETDGKGSVAAATGQTVRVLRRRWQGKLTDERVALLSDVAALAAGAQTLVELQLDLKAYTPVPDAALVSLGRIGRAAGAARARQQHLGPGSAPVARTGARPGPGFRSFAAPGCGSGTRQDGFALPAPDRRLRLSG